MYGVVYLALLFLSSTTAGLLGALVGLGGAVVLVPIYVLFLGVPLQYASGAALISTIATSAGSASVYLKHRIANSRIGISLTSATTSGALLGSLMARYIYQHNYIQILYIIFGFVLLFSVYVQLTKIRSELPKYTKPDKTTRIFRLYGEYYDPALGTAVKYHGIRWWLGWLVMFTAGALSGLLGIGSGPFKVLALDWAMNLPIKVSTTTSNFMIGITAAASGSMYWAFGYIQPVLAGVTALGVLAGANLGTKMLIKMRNKRVRALFALTLAALGIQMIIKGLG